VGHTFYTGKRTVLYVWTEQEVNMKIEDRFEFKNKAPPLTFEPEDMVIVAVKAMSEKNYGASVIIDKDNKPIGIITERDFMRRLINKGLDASITPIKDIMTSDLKIARGEDNVANWIRVMSNERFRHLPVVDSQGVLLNIMSQGDFVSYTWPQLFAEFKSKTTQSVLEKYQLYIIRNYDLYYCDDICV
jgi:CBS domain-containing protein